MPVKQLIADAKTKMHHTVETLLRELATSPRIATA